MLAATTLNMTEGEIMQIERRHDSSLSENDYFEILRLKTARLIAAAAKTGAYLGDFSISQEDAIEKFAEKIGIAFQLVDDTLDFLADEKGWGKPIGKDFKEGNLTLPIIQLLQVAESEIREWLEKVIQNQEYDDLTIQRVNSLLLKNNVFNYCFVKAEKIIEEGNQYIQQFSDTPEFDALYGLAGFFLRRAY
ncbi:MAG: hypothetical protein A2161_20945 [Candidatus Schekmanbacteria bacterium RBG_13_48_7]|uniref:Uncharacterized protein n=1 Tax=Candidatus Schekmanbacteria bacterium RBG_13_48_7 TaxID=1817878 RepID=A0A1F7RZZ1_9BACT|nr:MAG: hypothetical protein A2161_20945 [Candidatus Schekmanbacteria bacterium RBG_13_48_7]